jgi:uncharacterized protein (TIGR03000 family)
MIREQNLCGGVVRLTAAIALLTVGTGWALAGGSAGSGGHGSSSGGSHGGSSGGYGYGHSYGGYGYGGYGRGYGGYGYGGYGHGYGGYGYGGYGYGRGYGGYGYGRGYGGYGYVGYGYGRGYYGYGYGPGFFGGYYPFDYGYSSYYRRYAGNDGYSAVSMDGYGRSSDPSYAVQASSPPAMVGPAPALSDTTVVFDLRVPADALVWINDSKTEQTGALRRFVSPPLAPKQAFLYDIRCQWEQNGRQQEQTRHVTVRAGDRFTLNFLQ